MCMRTYIVSSSQMGNIFLFPFCGDLLFYLLQIPILIFFMLLVRKSGIFDLYVQNMLLKSESNVCFLVDGLIALERIFFRSFFPLFLAF